MLNSISYKMDIEDIKSKIRENYMQIAHQFVVSDEYKSAKKRGITEIIIDMSVYFLIDFMLFVQSARHSGCSADDFMLFAFLMLILSPLALNVSYYFQNLKFVKKIKKSCIKGMLQNLSDTEYLKVEELPKKSCILTNEDIVGLRIFGKFSKKLPDDVMFGNYKGCDYNVQEVRVSTMSDKARKYFMGMALKTNINLNINDWIEIYTKNFFEKPCSVWGYFFVFFIIGLFFIYMFFGILSLLPYYQYIFSVLVIIDLIISYYFAKIISSNDKKNYNLLRENERLSNNAEIDEKIAIKTPDNVLNIDDIVTIELCNVIEKLGTLFKTKDIFCRFNKSDLILLVNTQENLFEIGTLLFPPTNKRVAERFISQQAGILLFMDYVKTTLKTDE